MINNIKPPGQNYRNDIDVLRAIAVGGVIAFHYGLLHVSGGFVGVDIFFVISGFLISGQILSSTNNNQFILKDFLSRRFLRIYPALLAVVITVFILSWAVLDPQRFAQLSIDAEAALFGLSNIINYSDSGYFETPAQEKPLLHLWSIAVEIQFYIICALALPAALNKFGKENLSKSLYVIIIANLVASTYALFVDQSSAFYFLNNRLWEFCVGGLVATNVSKISLSQKQNEFLYPAGLLLIVISFFIFDAGSLFPGPSAAIPVLGAALMIISGHKSSLSTLIQNKISLFIGKISYSLYLVHWPLFVFLSIYHHSLLQDRVAKYSLLAAALVAAIILNRFVEDRYRREIKILRLSISNKFLLLFFALIATTYVNFKNDGLYARLTPSDSIARNIESYNTRRAKSYTWKSFDKHEQFKEFKSSKKKLLIIGDSQAADVFNLLVEANIEDHYEIITRKVWNECGAPYLSKDQRYEILKNNQTLMNKPDLFLMCAKQMDALDKSKLIITADTIIAAYSWNSGSFPHVKELYELMQKNSEAKKLFVGSKSFDKSSIELYRSHMPSPELDHLAFEARNADAIELNNRLSQMFGSNFIDIYQLLCQKPQESCDVIVNLNPVMWDKIHLSPEAIRYYAKDKTKQLFKILY